MSKRNASEKACVTHSMLSPVKNEERERMSWGQAGSAEYFSISGRERSGPFPDPYAPSSPAAVLSVCTVHQRMKHFRATPRSVVTGDTQRVPDPHFGRNKDEECGRDPKAQRALWLFIQRPHGLLMKTSHCHSNTSNPKHLTLLGNTLSHPSPTANYYRLLTSF